MADALAPPVNLGLAAVFDELGACLLYLREPWVKVRAYVAFAELLRTLPDPVGRLAADGRLRQLPGVGEAIAKKVEQFLESGTFPALERLGAAVPPGAREMLRAGLSPALVRHLEGAGYRELAAVEAALADGSLAAASVPSRLRPALESFAARLPRDRG